MLLKTKGVFVFPLFLSFYLCSRCRLCALRFSFSSPSKVCPICVV